jgi:membrane-associated HD superfamily phosphohydrolase
MYRNRDSNRNNGTGSSSGSSKKEKEKHILDTIDTAINELVYEKTQIIKAYNYYHAKRDPEQFRHLEENYGIGTPTSVEFTPLTRKHIDVLVGEYLSTPVLPRVSCKDSRTISNIFRDKQNKINSEIAKALNTHLRNTLYASILGQPGVPDKAIQQQLTDLYESIDRNFISEYEIAGQNIIDWAMQSRAIDFANQRKIMLIDLLVSGTVYYKVCPSPSQTNLTLRVLNPINTFVDRNPASPYLKDSSRAVIRSYLTKQQILAKYGKFLTEEDLSELDKLSDYSIDGSATTYLRSYDYVVGDTVSDGILGGFEVTPLLPSERSTSQSFRVFPVYEVE